MSVLNSLHVPPLRIDDDIDPDNPDFYVNICQPLNPIPGVNCPPGAAICMDPYDGPPVVSSLTNAVLYTILKKKKKKSLIALICLTKAVTSQGLNVNKIIIFIIVS